MREETINIQKRLVAARKKSFNFDQMVKLCDTEIELFVSKAMAKNDKPTTDLCMPVAPSETLVSILLPVVPLSPNEVQLLLEYLDDKYINGEEGAVVGGNYFSIRKCFFKDNLKLTTHMKKYYHY